MRSCVLKKILPFALTFVAGTALLALPDLITLSVDEPRAEIQTAPFDSTGASDARRLSAPPKIHVLSVDLIDENIAYAGGGKAFESVQIIHPPDSQYVPAKVKDYRQGVMQVSLRFGEDGVISEITPLPYSRRHDCGICLRPGEKVSYIDPNAPDSSELTRSAVEAVKQIRFIPEQSEGRAVPTHGLVECVFRLD